MRNFTSPAADRAEYWRNNPYTEEAWQLRPDLGSHATAAAPFWVSSASGVVGVAKPLMSGAVPFASCEKIASDLAYDLNLPVPPVILWDRGIQSGGRSRYVAISAVPFPQPQPWGTLQSDPALAALADAIRKKMTEPGSAMAVFDAWLHNTDHNNHPGNLLISLTSDAAQTLRAAYIDYSYSMAHSWPGNEWSGVYCAGMYDPQIPVDLDVVRRTVDQIRQIPEANIRDVVERISGDYITSTVKANVVAGLLDRQRRLTDIMKTQFKI